MVYESDFYTTRRPYRPSTYSVTRPQVDWEKVPFVPRPSLVPDPITAFGKRQKAQPRQRPSILDPAARAAIKPSALVLLAPIKPYVSARDITREKVLNNTPRHYVVTDRVDTPRTAAQQYSYSYNSTTESRNSNSPYSTPQRSSYTSTTERRSGTGPGGYNYTSERSSSLGGPGGYNASYSSTASGRLPGGTTYRHYSYRV